MATVYSLSQACETSLSTYAGRQPTLRRGCTTARGRGRRSLSQCVDDIRGFTAVYSVLQGKRGGKEVRLHTRASCLPGPESQAGNKSPESPNPK